MAIIGAVIWATYDVTTRSVRSQLQLQFTVTPIVVITSNRRYYIIHCLDDVTECCAATLSHILMT